MEIKGNENNKYVLKIIGKKIKDYRIRKALSQKELADMSGVSFSTITRLEKGESTSLDNFLKVLQGLDLLKNIDILIPDKPESAMDIWKPKEKRKRVSLKQKQEQQQEEYQEQQQEIDWIWRENE